MADSNKFVNQEMDVQVFLDMMTKIIGNVEQLQNSPPHHVPKESLTADIVVEYLKPVTQPNGPLVVRKIEYHEGRGNLIIEYPAAKETTKCISFVGSHMDVVPANPEDWDRNPFELTRDEDNPDKIYGRGVTDCSGHVGLLAQVMRKLAEQKASLSVNLFVVFIANEENSAIKGVGIDQLEKEGELKRLAGGPLYWVDSANFGPTLGTAGMACWKLKVEGKKCHSGMPQNGINALELGMQAVQYLQKKFFARFPAHESEAEYKFITSSSMKPTQIELPPGSVNQIPGECTIKGDIRFLPFYKADDIVSFMNDCAKNIPITELEYYGASRYELPAEDLTGKITFEFFNDMYKGVACDKESEGCKALIDGINKYHEGGSEPFSLTGSLPIIADLKEAGFDTQCVGFGVMAAYHAVNEYALISQFQEGFKICMHIIDHFNDLNA